MALLLSACSEAGSRGREAPKPTPFVDFDTLFIERSACLFDCPVFELDIASDGRVRHSGPAFERTGGPHDSRIDEHGLAQIAKALRDARVDGMRATYQDEKDGCESRMTDMSTLSLHVSRDQGRRNKNVILYIDQSQFSHTISMSRHNRFDVISSRVHLDDPAACSL